MAIHLDPHDRAPLTALLGRLTDDAQRLVRAEVKLAKETARFRFSEASVGLGLLAFVLLLAQASVTVFLVGILVWLGRLIGPIGATLVVTLVGLGLCALLARIAIGRIAKAATSPIPGTSEVKR